MRRGIGREREAVRFGRVAQRVAHDTWLDDRRTRIRIDGYDAVHVFACIGNDRHVHALAVLRRAAAAREERHVVAPAGRDGLDQIVDIGGHDDGDRHLPVVRCVRCIQRLRSLIEAHFAANA